MSDPNEAIDAIERRANDAYNAALSFPTDVVGAPVAACQAFDARVVSAVFLDGDREVTSDVTQWVNLSATLLSLAYVIHAPDNQSMARCGRTPRIRIRFDFRGQRAVTVRLAPLPDNVGYDAAEQGRNEAFTGLLEKSYKTEADGTLTIDDLTIPAAGGNGYQLEAEDENGNVAVGPLLTARRLVFVQEFVMRGLPGMSDWADVVAEYARHGVALVVTGPPADIDHQVNIDPYAERAELVDGLRIAYNASRLKGFEPHAIAIAFTEFLRVASEGNVVEVSALAVGPPVGTVDVDIVDAAANFHRLWTAHFEPADDWYEQIVFVPDVATLRDPATSIGDLLPIVIDRSACTVIDNGLRLRIDVSSLPNCDGTLRLVVKWVDRALGGIALGGNIVVATLAYRDDVSDAVIHELGHKLQLAPNGEPGEPNASPLLYSGKGHVGPHCASGLTGLQRALPDYHAVSGNCVMFGRLLNIDAFCGDCASGLRRADFRAGWERF